MSTLGNYFPYGWSQGPDWSFIEAAWHPQASANYKSQISDTIISGGGITNTVPYTISIDQFLSKPRSDVSPMYNILSTHQIRIYVNGVLDITQDGVIDQRMNRHWMAFVTWNGSAWVINNQTNFNAAQTSTAFAYPTLTASGSSLFLNLFGSSAGTSSSRTVIKYSMNVLNFYAHDYTSYPAVHRLTEAISHNNLCATTLSSAPTSYYYPPWSPAPPPPPPGPPPPPPGPPGKIVCTAMNEAYGFGSFRNKIWLKYAKDNLNKYHEIGYHTVFKPLIKIGYDPINKHRYFNTVVRLVMEELVRRRSADLRAEMSGQKRDWRGRIYRFLWEPMCYIVGRIKEK